MKEALYVICRVVQIMLGAIELCMFLRAILSWFIRDENNKIMIFLVFVTEPIIIPFRILCSKIRAFENVPLDIPFFIAFLFLSIVNSFLPALTL